MAPNRIAICAAAILLAAASPSPERTPTLFTTHNYGLTAHIPPGLSHCPYPTGWVGADHGIAIYLTKPKACDAAAPEAADDEAARLPQIRLFYAYNTAEMALAGEARPPRTNAELHRQACAETRSDWPAKLSILGMPGATCFEHRGDMIILSVGTLYRQEPVGPDASAPDSQVWLLLQTTAQRYPYDLNLFQAVLATIAQCRPPDRPPLAPRPVCSPFIPW